MIATRIRSAADRWGALLGLAMSLDIPIGTEFAGYRITGVLGRGGMSVVYAAEHLGLGRTVALKVLAGSLAHDESFRERFVRESKLVAALDHPNIIPIYDAGESEGYLYIAMRHVEGGDLGTLIKQEGPLALGQTIFFIEQIGGALDQAHSQDLVHRDVKPANILIAGSSDRVYLTDFGVVKQTATPGLTKTGFFLGTFAYAAPEQIERKPIDGRTDIYALGCMLYECLSGDPPFDADTEASMLHAHLVEVPPKLTNKRPDLPHAINNVIATAMAKAQEDRFPTAGELVRALRAVALGTTGVREPARSEAPVPSGPPPGETVLSPAAPPPNAASPPPPPTEPPAPAQPPNEPGPVPPPVPRKEPRTVTLSGSRLALVVGALVALVAAAVVVTVVLSGGGKKNAAATTTGTTAPTVAAGLAGVVPEPVFNCANAAKTPGAAQTMTCSPPAAAGSDYYPNTWQLSLYPTTAALREAYDALRRNHDVGANFGRCNGIEWGGEAAWTHGPGKPGGRQFCYFDGNVAVIVWTHEKLGQPSHIDLLGIARSNGSDHSNLFNWYRFWHHRIGKCATANCVAHLV